MLRPHWGCGGARSVMSLERPHTAATHIKPQAANHLPGHGRSRQGTTAGTHPGARGCVTSVWLLGMLGNIYVYIYLTHTTHRQAPGTPKSLGYLPRHCGSVARNTTLLHSLNQNHFPDCCQQLRACTCPCSSRCLHATITKLIVYHTLSLYFQ